MTSSPGGIAGEPAALSESQIFGLTSAGMLELARDYVMLGRVHRPRRRGPAIAAEVDGTDATYTCRAEILGGAGAAPSITPGCDCPSHRPYCKHILALLLLWAGQPAAFAPIDAWEVELHTHAPAELADLLAATAMGADALHVLQEAAVIPDWPSEPPGRCLQEWERFRTWAEANGQWPEAALDLGARIAGPPGSPGARVAPDGVAPALAARQLAWWLTRMLAVLPGPALVPWLEHLFARLNALAAGRPESVPPELAVWLARLAAALPEARAPERAWLAHFSAHIPTLGPAFEAELQRARWEAELTLRLAVAPALPAPDTAHTASGHRAALAAFEAARAGD